MVLLSFICLNFLFEFHFFDFFLFLSLFSRTDSARVSLLIWCWFILRISPSLLFSGALPSSENCYLFCFCFPLSSPTFTISCVVSFFWHLLTLFKMLFLFLFFSFLNKIFHHVSYIWSYIIIFFLDSVHCYCTWALLYAFLQRYILLQAICFCY